MSGFILNHCMEWVGECERATLAATQAVDKQSQAICNIRENVQTDVHQELQHQYRHFTGHIIPIKSLSGDFQTEPHNP